MTMVRRLHPFSIAAVLLSLVGTLASCGGSTSTGTTGGNFPIKATVNIPEADRFEPFLLEIAVGGTVTWTNKDADAHTIVSMPTDPVDFKVLAMSGKSVSETFTQPGIYGYYCDAHSDYDRATGLIKAKQGADAYPCDAGRRPVRAARHRRQKGNAGHLDEHRQRGSHGSD
ncbi:MAG: hypothetical protein E6I68_11825 [Chloroflexi bacterium]|nr:MAG: hypothetical protein E6I68_11825 [Chloroflexota bacterium]